MFFNIIHTFLLLLNTFMALLTFSAVMVGNAGGCANVDTSKGDQGEMR